MLALRPTPHHCVAYLCVCTFNYQPIFHQMYITDNIHWRIFCWHQDQHRVTNSQSMCTLDCHTKSFIWDNGYVAYTPATSLSAVPHTKSKPNDKHVFWSSRPHKDQHCSPCHMSVYFEMGGRGWSNMCKLWHINICHVWPLCTFKRSCLPDTWYMA